VMTLDLRSIFNKSRVKLVIHTISFSFVPVSNSPLNMTLHLRRLTFRSFSHNSDDISIIQRFSITIATRGATVGAVGAVSLPGGTLARKGGNSAKSIASVDFCVI